MFVYLPEVHCDRCRAIYAPCWMPVENRLSGRVKMKSTCGEVRLEAFNLGWRRYKLRETVKDGKGHDCIYEDLCPECVPYATGKLLPKPNPLHKE